MLDFLPVFYNKTGFVTHKVADMGTGITAPTSLAQRHKHRGPIYDTGRTLIIRTFHPVS